MTGLGLSIHGGTLAALALLSACYGPTTSPSISGLDVRSSGKTLFVNGRPVAAERVSPGLRYAAIHPDARSNSRSFEYVGNLYYNDIAIFNYPKTNQQIGTIGNAGGAECADALYGYGKKYFWVVDGYNKIQEYEVVRKPIKTLSVPYSYPDSCAMDTSGDLAVGIIDGSGRGTVVIFKGASGSGIAIPTPSSSVYFLGYDNRGNLFADGFDSGGKFALAELPKGGKFETITTSNTVRFPGSVQWDGRYVTVFDQDVNALYRYTASGTHATLRGTVEFVGSSDCAQTWIAKGLLYCADAGNNDAEVFKYPAGGAIVAVLTGNIDLPLGVTAAQKPGASV